MGMYTLIDIHFQKYVLLFLTYNPKLKEQRTLKIMNWFTKRKELEEIITMVGKGRQTEILKIFPLISLNVISNWKFVLNISTYMNCICMISHFKTLLLKKYTLFNLKKNESCS